MDHSAEKIDVRFMSERDGEKKSITITLLLTLLSAIPYFESALNFAETNGRKLTLICVGWSNEDDKKNAPVFSRTSLQMWYRWYIDGKQLTIDDLSVDLFRIVSFLMLEEEFMNSIQHLDLQPFIRTHLFEIIQMDPVIDTLCN